MLKLKKLIAFSNLVFVFLFSDFAFAQSEGIIKYRKNVMKSTAGHMGAIVDILKNNLAIKGHLVEHARSLMQNSKMTISIFPNGSNLGLTNAKQSIWENWSKFENASHAFVDESTRLLDMVEKGDLKEIAKQVRKTAKTCGGCHRYFRKRD